MVSSGDAQQFVGHAEVSVQLRVDFVQSRFDIAHFDALVELGQIAGDGFFPVGQLFFIGLHYRRIRGVNMTHFHNAVFRNVIIQLARQVNDRNISFAQDCSCLIDALHLHQEIYRKNGDQHDQ